MSAPYAGPESWASKVKPSPELVRKRAARRDARRREARRAENARAAELLHRLAEETTDGAEALEAIEHARRLKALW